MPVCKKGGEGGRESRPTDRQPEAREERKEGAVVPFLLRTSPASSLPPSFSGLPLLSSRVPRCSSRPSVHPSWILFHGVKWRRAHLGNVLSIDWNEEEEEGIGGSSRSKSWSFEFPPFPALSRLADSDKPDTFPASLPPSAADRPTGILFTVAPSSSEYLFCRAIFQADRPTGFLPSRWRWSE